jgi:transposase-like protein
VAIGSQSWQPPFCPNAACDSHAKPGTWRFKKKGFYERLCGPRRIQRYVCRSCRRHFSSQTFSTTYWLKHPRALRPLFERLLSCSALRQVSRELRLTHGSLQRQTERLGRHCLLLLEALRPQGAPTEPLVLDGFRTFEHSQYWPFDLQLLVGAHSHYVYAFNDAELRRSGTMRPSQRERRKELETAHGRPHPLATREAVEEAVGRVLPPGSTATIASDEHAAYPRAFRRLRDRRIIHATTSSKASRTPQNPLFPANLADLLLRHSSANHKRETIAFSKRRQGALYRVAIWAVWRNFMKSRSENRRDEPPAVALGHLAKRLTTSGVLAERRFPWRQVLAPWVERCYFARIPTRAIARCRSHTLRYAV